MRSNILMRFCIVLTVMFGFHSLSAQTLNDIPNANDLDLAEFLNAGADAGALISQYTNPFMRGIAFASNGGWYNTAKPHKTFGFDITVSTTLAKAPESDYSFVFNQDDYSFLSLANVEGQPAKGATVFGDPNDVYAYQGRVEGPGGALLTPTFKAPPGIDYEQVSAESLRGYVPLIMIQGGIGLIKNTELKVRWVPTATIDDIGFESGMLGLGILHDIKQWIPGVKHVPIDLSVLIGFNRVFNQVDINKVSSGSSRISAAEGAVAEFNINSFTYQLLVSKKLSVLTLYGGVGFNNASTELKLLGDYTISGDDENTGLPVSIELEDPVNQEFSANTASAKLGARVKLAVLTIHADYTFQKYNLLTAGIGISIR